MNAKCQEPSAELGRKECEAKWIVFRGKKSFMQSSLECDFMQVFESKQ